MTTENTDLVKTNDFGTQETTTGTLRIGVPESYGTPVSLNPFIDHRFFDSANPGRNIYNRLIRWNDTGGFEGDLAYQWEISDDGLNYTFYLYENITWHDGSKFNASDVKYTIELILSDPNVEDYWKMYYNPLKITSIETPNEYTITFILGDPYYSFLEAIAETPILPKHLDEGKGLMESPLNNNPVGTGAFKFVKWDNSINMTLEVNPNYFKGSSKLTELQYRWDIPMSKLPDFLMNNTIDLISEFVDPNKINELSLVTGKTTKSRSELGYLFLGVNLRNSILNDCRVRQAFAHAINTTKICEAPYLGYAQPATGPISPTAAYWYNPNVKTYDFNLTRAEELLDEAGYTRDKTGIRFNISLKVDKDDPMKNNTSILIANWLQSIGVNVTLQPESKGQVWQEVFVYHTFDIVVSGFTDFSLYPGVDQYTLWHTGEWLNAWNYSNSRVDYLLEQNLVLSDETKRQENFYEIQEILVNETELPNVFLCYRTRVSAYNNDFHFEAHSSLPLVDPYYIENAYYEPTLSGEGKSPIENLWTDSYGRKTGSFNGTVFEEIPNSTYVQNQNLVKLYFNEGNYTALLHGTGNGEYHLEVVNIAFHYKYTTIPYGYITADKNITYLVQVFSDGTFRVTTNNMIDIYKDGKIDARDVARVASVYGSYGPNYKYPGSPEHPRWYQMADINSDNKIDVRDVAIVCRNYGTHF